MSQQLSNLVRPALASNEAANFFEKYVSPSSPISPQSVPDGDARPSVVLESTGSFLITQPPAATGKTVLSYDVYIVSTVAAGSNLGTVTYNTYTDGTSDYPTSLDLPHYADKNEPDPLMSSVAQVGLGPQNGTASVYRICAKSVTSRLVANDLTNQGTVYGASIGNSTYASGGTATLTNIPIMTFTNTQVLPHLTNVSTIPGSYTGLAKDGMYAINRNGGTFNYYNGDTCYLQTLGSGVPGTPVRPLPIGSSGSSGAGQYPWWPCNDWDLTITIFDSISPTATISITTHCVYEIVPEVGSILTSLCRVPSVDVGSLEVIKRLHREFGQFYPADFNDWGSLWQGAKNFFNDNRDLIGNLAGAVPVAGNALQAMVKMLPTESKSQRKANQADIDARQQEDKLLRRAEVTNARAIVGDLTGVSRQRRPKAGTLVQRSQPVMSTPDVKTCDVCGKKFSTRKAMLDHYSIKHAFKR